MKNVYFAFLFLISSTTFAQSYIPMPDSGGVWINKWQEYYYNGMWVEYFTPYYTSYCTHGEDTTISMIDYFKVDTCQGGYKGAMRNDNGKVWWVPADSTQEFLLYDFTVQPGDTVYDVFIDDFWGGNPALYDVIIPNQANTIDSIQRNGEWLTTIDIGTQWIEGIGNSGGLFVEYWPNISNYFINLVCHSVNDTTLYPNYSSQAACNWQTIGYEDPELVFNVYPNPATTDLIIDLKQKIPTTIKVLDYQGKVLIEKVSSHKSNTLDISDLRRGAYLLVIETETARGIHRFVKE